MPSFFLRNFDDNESMVQTMMPCLYLYPILDRACVVIEWLISYCWLADWRLVWQETKMYLSKVTKIFFVNFFSFFGTARPDFTFIYFFSTFWHLEMWTRGRDSTFALAKAGGSLYHTGLHNFRRVLRALVGNTAPIAPRGFWECNEGKSLGFVTHTGS